MPGYTQDTRIGELKFPGDPGLVLVRFSGTEAVSEPFVFHVDALHETRDDINFDESIGKNVTIAVKTIANEKRYFVGMLTEASRTDDALSGFLYHLVLKPWTHLLTRRVNSRIFHNSTVNTILSKVLGGYGQLFLDKTERGYPEMEYTVQHRETDWNFVCRLMEAHGISYHFEFSDGKHTLILADTGREPNAVGGNARKFVGGGGGQLRDEEALFEWQKERAWTTGKVMVNDYYFEKPSASQIGKATTGAKYDHADIEDYSQYYNQSLGKKTEAGEGTKYAEYIRDSYRSQDHHFFAAGDCPGLCPGYLVSLGGLPKDSGDYVVIRASHTLVMQGYRTGETKGAMYSGKYHFYPDESGKPYTPPMRTPRPVIGGIETAIVVGGAEIDVDKYGRIEVQFHWNTPDAKDKSIRARVAQLWAGSSWGAVYWPRISMEVVVTFIGGDPDRPLVIGTVYNGQNMPPYDLESKDQENIAGVKSRTVGGGGYNEFVFDDTSGKELVRMHAQKDHETLIENDEKRDIKNNRITTITTDDTLTVDQNIMIEAKKSITLKVGPSTIKMDMGSITIESPSVTVKGTADLTTEGGATATHKAGGPMTITGAMVKIN
jgi:type VI secretion system secreted protein VgrG